MNALTQYINLYTDHCAEICAHAPQILNDMRQHALDRLTEEDRTGRGRPSPQSVVSAELPQKGQETYPAISVNDMFAPDYGVNINRMEFPVDTAVTFHCGVPNISTLLALVVNDSFRGTQGLERNLPEGVLMMSLARAAVAHPDIVEKYLGKLVADDNVAAQLNTLLLQDGVLVYVPRGVQLAKPLQLVNIFNAVAPIMGVRRVLVVVDDGASASMLVCDHSQRQDIQYLSNQVVEIYVGRDASLEYYDLEESSALTSRLSQTFVRQADNSRLVINGTTLVGGATRNSYTVTIAGHHADTRLAGMAIGADSQIVDNTTDVRHLSHDCTSSQMFKYVLEDQSVGSFYGRIVVDEAAKYTNAYQSNRNILASTDARMYTRPQLEIYCEEVKCSHGATVGQLDANALFYMRSRGIPEAEARLMLMQAFMADVIDTVSLPALKTRLQQLVEARLCGNHTLCAECPASK